MKASRVAIVDPYSGGANLAPALKRRGHESVMVQSTPHPPDLFRRSFVAADFVHSFVFSGDVRATADQLEKCGVVAVIPGCDMGVELSDALSEYLGTPSNGTSLSAARRDKALMSAAVSASGLRTIPQRFSNDVEELLAWANKGSRWPVIAKPRRSTGSDSVLLCGSDVELRAAFARITGSASVLGEPNASVLVQEFIRGTEYIVDIVSRDGLHRPAAFWRYTRPPAARPDDEREFVCYDAMVLLPYHGTVQRELFAYACAVLDALGIQHGPSHCEIMRDNTGPVLVEVGARLSAGNNSVLSATCGGPCALQLTLDAMLEPERFKAEVDPLPELVRTAANFFLRPSRSGILLALPRLAQIEALASFESMRIGARIGLPIPAVAGLVTLVHDDRETVESDLLTLRSIQSEDFYRIDSAVERTGAS